MFSATGFVGSGDTPQPTEPLTIYRGAELSTNGYGMSWSLIREIAEDHAEMQLLSKSVFAAGVFEVTIPPDAVLAMAVEDAGEDEVIVNPHRLRGSSTPRLVDDQEMPGLNFSWLRWDADCLDLRRVGIEPDPLTRPSRLLKRRNWCSSREASFVGAVREELGRLFSFEERHRRLFARLTLVVAATAVIDACGTALIYFLERHAHGTEVQSVGQAFFFTTVQLLTVSSQLKNPITPAGRALDIALELWAVIVVAGAAGAVAAFFQNADSQ